MKTLVSILFFLGTFGFCSAQLSEIPQQEIPEEYGYIVKIGQQMPETEFELTDGRKISSADLKGKIVMLQFTASWCGVCRKEMPHIESKIWQKHKNNPHFALYGIDMDEPLDKVKKFAAQGAGVTRNVIIDKNGKIVYMTRLYKEEEFNEMVEVIELLLKS